MEYFKCGTILKTHGIKGDLKIKPLTDFNRFFKGSHLYVLFKDEYIEEEVVKSVTFQNGFLISFKGKEDINLVEKYHGCDIYVKDIDRGELESGYYYSEIIGLLCYNQHDKLVGKVINIIEYPHAKYLEIETDKKKCLVPFIDEFIIDVKEDRIIINEIEGLL